MHFLVLLDMIYYCISSIYLCSTRQRKEFEAFYCAGITITLAQNFFISTFLSQSTEKSKVLKVVCIRLDNWKNWLVWYLSIFSTIRPILLIFLPWTSQKKICYQNSLKNLIDSGLKSVWLRLLHSLLEQIYQKH